MTAIRSTRLVYDNAGRLVRYQHPRKGGWYHARILKAGRKWALIEDLGNKARHKIQLSELREAA